MDKPHPGKAKAAIYTIAACMARAGQSNSQPDAGQTESPIVHQYLLQEVTMIAVSTPKEKAAVTAAAQSAQVSAITGNSIVPPLHRDAMGFCSFFSSTSPLHPFQPIKPSPYPPNA